MNLKSKFLVFIVIAFSAHDVSGQTSGYNYKRDLQKPNDVWHSIVLPPAMFSKVTETLSDIRILGQTENNKIIEAPYLLQRNEDRHTTTAVLSNMINATSNEKGYYFTFEISTEQMINQLELDFKISNFDWKVMLEGSQDQLEWFTIVKGSRILSIRNEYTDYAFTRLNFPAIHFKYLRLFIPADTDPGLLSAKLTKEQFIEGRYRDYPVAKSSVKEDKKLKQTIAEIELETAVPLSRLKIQVKDSIDYYRPVTIRYLDDSIKTADGWQYKYSTAATGMLSAMESNEFKLPYILTKQLKIIIHNQDNMPLELGSFEVSGNVYELIARFTYPASYRLVYGNDQISKPKYDIVNFKNKIPVNPVPLSVGKEIMIGKIEQAATPLFENKAWLWGIMGAVILVLGFFSVQMMKK